MQLLSGISAVSYSTDANEKALSQTRNFKRLLSLIKIIFSKHTTNIYSPSTIEVIQIVHLTQDKNVENVLFAKLGFQVIRKGAKVLHYCPFKETA
jgi:hypothetical protein